MPFKRNYKREHEQVLSLSFCSKYKSVLKLIRNRIHKEATKGTKKVLITSCNGINYSRHIGRKREMSVRWIGKPHWSSTETKTVCDLGFITKWLMVSPPLRGHNDPQLKPWETRVSGQIFQNQLVSGSALFSNVCRLI